MPSMRSVVVTGSYLTAKGRGEQAEGAEGRGLRVKAESGAPVILREAKDPLRFGRATCLRRGSFAVAQDDKLRRSG